MKKVLLYVLISYMPIVFSCNSTENRRMLLIYNSFSIEDHFDVEIQRFKNAADFGDEESAQAYNYIQSLIHGAVNPVISDSAKRRLMLAGLCDENGSFMKEVSIAIQAKANEFQQKNSKIIRD